MLLEVSLYSSFRIESRFTVHGALYVQQFLPAPATMYLQPMFDITCDSYLLFPLPSQ